ncbi:MAG: response regulator transcription factor [Bacteroidales bacterium]|nr:response regulator transcription factor [Bacteroidales bacterium]
MNILIIEDEQLAADRLEEMLLELVPEAKILAKLGSIRASVRWLQAHQADLIFLDIQLSDGISFSIFEEVMMNTPIIFTTAFDQYAIKAFQLNSIAYLLKPIRKTELKESLQKYKSLKTAFGVDFEQLLAGIEGRNPAYRKRFLIQVGDKIKKIELVDVAYFYAMEKSVFMKTNQDQDFAVDYTLDNLEATLDPEKFFRVNRKYLVNMDAIASMVAWSRSRIKLDLKPPVSDKEDVVVSIERSAAFKQWLNS